MSVLVINLTLLAMLVGFVRIVMVVSKAGFHLSLCLLLISLAYLLRADWWEFHYIIRQIVNIEFRLQQNTFFNMLAFWGSLHGHYALYMTIPEEDRNGWNIFNAWVYPPIKIIRFMKGKNKDV
jgi:hypothetical protein